MSARRSSRICAAARGARAARCSCGSSRPRAADRAERGVAGCVARACERAGVAAGRCAPRCGTPPRPRCCARARRWRRSAQVLRHREQQDDSALREGRSRDAPAARAAVAEEVRHDPSALRRWTTTCGSAAGSGSSSRTTGGCLSTSSSSWSRPAPSTITTELALDVGDGCRRTPHPHRWRQRLGIVRGFARYVATIDPQTEIPSEDLLPATRPRVAPYIYSPAEITALMDAAGR